MRVLVALPTTNQMYSGVGRALFELSGRLADRVEFTFAIDDRDPRALRRLWSFAASREMPVCIGPHRMDEDCVDPTNLDLPAIVGRGDWDLVELVGFANAATGRDVLDHLDDRAALCYTPHDQPLWTVPMTAAQRAHVAAVHRRVLNRADLAFADSAAEARGLQRLCPSRLNVVEMPLGCDFDSFPLGRADRPPQLLFVGDLAEIRKRFDRVVAAFSRVLERWPEYRLVVIGNRSDEAGDRIPDAIRPAVDLRGYVDEGELRDAYATSRALILLSDVEAFGLPILEALACGTPAVLSRLETTSGLFGDCDGAHFAAIEEPEGPADALLGLLERWPDAVARARRDRPRLRAIFDWDRLADRKWRAFRAAWTRRNAWSWAA